MSKPPAVDPNTESAAGGGKPGDVSGDVQGDVPGHKPAAVHTVAPGWLQQLRQVGPAVIVASVVLGPGSILTNSKVGWQFGYSAVWVLALACGLMLAMTGIAMRVGVALEHSPCEELARRVSRTFAAVVGSCLFLVAASFQFSNNLGVLFAIEPLFDGGDASQAGNFWTIAVLVALNAAVIASLLVARNLYTAVERAMKLMVGLMLLAFAANLVMARPSLTGTLGGMLPNISQLLSTSAPNPAAGENLLAMLALVATTFSVGAAFYQAYLVKQRNWRGEQLATGTVDAIVGISTLGLMSLMIMVTAAAAFYQNPDITQLNSAADVAKQLRPLFGPAATWLFCLGIMAGALSSFLVNAMIGGCVLSDGFGYGSNINERAPRIATIASLLIGMAIAIAVKAVSFNTASLIVFAQSLTILGNPLLAGSILWLAMRPEVRQRRLVPNWLLALGFVGFALVCVLSLRTIWTVLLPALARLWQ